MIPSWAIREGKLLLAWATMIFKLLLWNLEFRIKATVESLGSFSPKSPFFAPSQDSCTQDPTIYAGCKDNTWTPWREDVRSTNLGEPRVAFFCRAVMTGT